MNARRRDSNRGARVVICAFAGVLREMRDAPVGETDENVMSAYRSHRNVALGSSVDHSILMICY